MQIIPAIDLQDHKVVRLQQGRLDEQTAYSEDILKVAEDWVVQGATRLHMVDLNGAFEGRPVHFDDIKKVVKNFPNLKVEIGGGIRSLDLVRQYFDVGVSFCILGTVAVENPSLAQEICDEFPGQIILGIDAKDGIVAIKGWDEQSTKTALEVVQKFKNCQLESIIYTDIAKDGMLSGMNFEHIENLKSCGFPVIASGGLSTLEDIDRLCQIGDIHGVIAGKALYEKRFSLKQAIERVQQNQI